MTKFEHVRFKNSMLAGNLLANAVGSGVAGFVILATATQLSPETEAFLWRFGYFFDPGIFLIICIMAWIYERPIRRYLDMTHQGMPPKPEMTLKAHQRLLNEPFFLLAVDFGIWLMAALDMRKSLETLNQMRIQRTRRYKRRNRCGPINRNGCFRR